MRESIEAIREGLRMGHFTNEASVSQGIVLRLLNELSWPTFDTSVVSPEYALQGRRVDFALCHPARKPIIFIEVKQVGQGVDAERQLFEYAFHRGVPLAILTTGQEWHFFLPAEQGDYGDRRVYKLDLLERDVEECIDRLRRYLDYRAVASGEALDAARADYRSISRQREIQRTLPEAWKRLVLEDDELLLELLADKVESLCGFRPENESVTRFLKRAAGVSPLPESPQREVEMSSPRASIRDSKVKSLKSSDPSGITTRGFGFMLHGERFSARNGRDVLVQVFQQLVRHDATFAERFATRPTSGKNRRPYLARSRKELFPGNEGLANNPSYSQELSPGSGWWIDVNHSLKSIERIVKMACEVAGIGWGSDLVLSLPKHEGQ